MRALWLLGLLLAVPVGWATGPYVHDGTIVGPNLGMYTHGDQHSFDVVGGESIVATVDWSTHATVALILVWYNGSNSCPIHSKSCILDEVVPSWLAYTTCSAPHYEQEGGIATIAGPLTAQLPAPGPGRVEVIPTGKLSTDDIPYRLTIAVDGQAPTSPVDVRRTQGVTLIPHYDACP